MEATKRRWNGWAVWLAMAGLALGLSGGLAAHATQAPPLLWLGDAIGPLGKVWTNALQVVVIPLVASLLLSSILAMPSGGTLGRWGWTSLATFFALLVAGALFAWGGASLFLELAPPGTLVLAQEGAGGKAASFGFGEWLEGLVPSNLFESLAKGELLPVMLLCIALGLAARSLPASQKDRLEEFFKAVRDSILVYVRWVMVLLPFGAFALSYAFTAEKGVGAAGVVLQFLVLILGLLVGFTLVLYPLAAILGRASIRRFALAALRPQATALSSRSSLASLPALVEAADEKLELPAPAASVVLPLAASVFKLNRTVSSTGKVLFAAAVIGIALSPGDLVAFVVTVILLSVSTPGIPSAGTNITLGAYIAAGIPAEVALLFEPVEPILDMFKTALNVTGNLAAAAIVSRFCGSTGEPQMAPYSIPAQEYGS